MKKQRVTWRAIYQFGGPNLRHQILLTFALIVAAAIGVCAYSIYAVESATTVSWVTPANIIAAVGVVFSLGMLREQFGEVKRRLEQLEEFNRDTLPRDYARKDVLEAGHGSDRWR